MRRTSIFYFLLIPAVGLFMILPLVMAESESTDDSETVSAEIVEANKLNEALEVYGWMIVRQTGLHMGYTDEEIDRILEGMRRAAQGTSEPENLQEILPMVREIVGKKAKAFQDKKAKLDAETASINITAGQVLFADLDNRGIAKTEKGLYYEIIEEGTDVRPTAADNVVVHYHGTYINGEVFDSSRDRGTPASFHMSGVIQGFKEGLKLIGEGGKAKLYIPPDLGYGNQSKGKIPAGSTLIFDIELIEIKKPVAKEIPPVEPS